jgi:hypothetical protein
MKIVLLLASICSVFFLAGCADNSLMTDEEYAKSKGPAPFAPDYSQVLPAPPSTLNPNRP